MLRTKGITASSVPPARLGMITQSKLYPLLVQYPVEGLAPVSCQKTWILIKATKKSSFAERPPYQVITEDIQDGFEDVQSIGAPSPDQPKQTYKIITMCNEKNRSALMLSPSHGKHIYAIAIITAISGNTLYAENVETVPRDEKDELATCMSREMTLVTRLMKHRGKEGTKKSWDETTSPLASRSCRKLGKSPTGPELDALDLPLETKKQNAINVPRPAAACSHLLTRTPFAVDSFSGRRVPSRTTQPSISTVSKQSLRAKTYETIAIEIHVPRGRAHSLPTSKHV